MKLSFMTYGVGKDIGRADMLKWLAEAGFSGVEWRLDQSQAHGIEVSLSAGERKQVVSEVAEAGLKTVSVATGNSYHDAASLQKNIDETRVRMELARDLGAPRVRVFGNNFPEGEAKEAVLERVTGAVRELAKFGEGLGVTVGLELHGQFDWRSCSRIAGDVDSPNFGLIWNSVGQDVVNGSVQEALDTAYPHLTHVHMHDIAGVDYPYRELFKLLQEKGYEGHLSMEAERDVGPDKRVFLHYYAELFRAWLELA